MALFGRLPPLAVARTHLEDVLLVLDVLHLLQADHVVYGKDLEGEVLPAAPVPAEADPGEGACRGEWSEGACRGEWTEGACR